MAQLSYGEEKLLLDLEDHVVAVHPDFELVGDSDIERIASVLGQHTQHNILYTGLSGVGRTAALYGIAQRKQRAIAAPQTVTETGLPLHIVDRRFLLLDVNALFDHNDPAVIERDIALIFKELKEPGHHVLVIEDTSDLLRGVRDNQVHGLISNLMKELKQGTFQAIWMVREESGRNKVAEVLDCHSDMRELFTVIEKEEPDKAEIEAILSARRRMLKDHFGGLEITDDAVGEIVSLTMQYPGLRLWTRSQPSRSITLLERTASTFVSREQTRPSELRDLEAQLAKLNEQLETNGADVERQARQSELESQIRAYETWWREQAQKLYQVQALMHEHRHKLQTAERKLEQLTAELGERLQSDQDDRSTTPSTFEMNQAKTPAIRESEQDIRTLRDNLKKIVNAAE